jgi:hypothetical protein
MTKCPRREDLQRLIAGVHSPERQQSLERHLDICGRCRQQIDCLAGVRGVVPDRPAPGSGRTPESPALKRAIGQLHADPEAATACLAAVGGPGARLPFLHPTDRPGFLGRLGAYDIRREVGRGGMGVVFEGFDPALNRAVAVKVLSPLSAATDEARGRFLREAQAAAALEHEHVVTIHAVDQACGMPFLVMQYVAGESLADRLAREGSLPFADVARIGAQVARGLAAAHAKGLVHRDVKPANILLEAGTGRAKIADFGLAKAASDEPLTGAGMVAGTPEFMSPEQATGGQVDARSDLFSLGVVLHAACCGASPFRAESYLLTLERVRREQAVPLDQVDPTLPDWFCAVVQRLLMKDPAARVSAAAELADILERPPAVHNAPPATGPASPPARAARRAWRVAPLAGLVVLAALAGFNRGQPGQNPRDDGARTDRPLVTGFVVAGRPQTYRDLSEAVAAAGDGDVIEVSGDGPFPTRPVRTEDKRLTIRAAPPSRPVFVTEVPSPRAKQPFLTADADARLEGLEVRWEMHGSTGWSRGELLGRSAIVSTAGRLTLDHCRVVTGARNICVGATGREVVLNRSHLIAGEQGLCVYWRPSPGGLRAEDCQFEGRAALSVSTAPEAANPRPAPLHLERNTFATSMALHLQLDGHLRLSPRQPLGVTARHNLVNCPQLVVLYGVHPHRHLDAQRPEDMTALLRTLVEWSEEANVYRRGGQFLTAGAVRHGGRLFSAQLDSLARWQEVWKLPPTRSVEGVIRFAARESGTDSLRLLAVDDPSGPGPVAGGDRPGPTCHASAATGR